MAYTECKTSHCYTRPEGSGSKEDSEYMPTPGKATRWPRGKCLQVLAVTAVNILSITFGTTIGWSTAVASTLVTEYDPTLASWVVTISMPSAIVGCILSGIMTMRLGLRKSLLAVGLPMAAGWIFLLDMKTVWSVLVGRILCGFTMGAVVVLVPLYVSEIVEISLRGRLGSFMMLFLNFGILLAYSVGGFLNPTGVAIFCGMVPFLFLAIFYLCPESPLYLFSTGRESAAIETLRCLRRSEEEVNNEIDAMRAAGKAAAGSEPKFTDLFRRKAARKATIIALGVLSCQQASGISPVMYYAGAIFMSAGGDMIVASCIVGGVQLAGSCLATVLMDMAGRRVLMIVSCVVMGLSQAALGYGMMPDSPAPSWTPVVSLSVFILAYALGAGPAPFVIASEVTAPRLKALTCTVAISYTLALSFAITKIFPDLSYYLGDHKVFWLFSVGCAASAVFCWFCVPETSGRSSATIQEELEGKITVKSAV